MLERLNSLWVGDRLGYIEHLCLLSARAVGHEFTVYSYTPHSLKNVPEGIEIADAREIMPEEKLVRYSDTGAVQMGANLFRYALLAKRPGYWVDMDFYFLKPLDFGRQYVFCWEYEGWINNALLRAPLNSPFVRDLCEIPQTNRRPPWYGPKRSLRYFWDRATKGDLKVEDLPWGTYSSGMVTYLVKKHGLTEYAESPDVFYPVRWKDAESVFTQPAEVVETMLSPNTKAVHMWYSRLVPFLSEPPPAGSYIASACAKFGVHWKRTDRAFLTAAARA